LFIPATLAVVLFLLGGPPEQAPPAPTREPHRRSVTLTGSPVEARIATGIHTVFVFGGLIRGQAIEVDRARIKVVDKGESSLIIEPLSEPKPGEHWTLRVPLADGQAPEFAEFALVSHPSEVDTELEVARREQPDTACQTTCAPCTAMSATDAVAVGLFEKHGVQTGTVAPFKDDESGFSSQMGVSYRAKSWVLVDVEILLPPGHLAWRPAAATLASKTGEARVRAVKVEPNKQYPAQVRVLVETDVPPPSAGLDFALQLHGPEGTPSLLIPKVKLPPAQENRQ
jgi:uncharacterized protein (TIGR02268 family)